MIKRTCISLGFGFLLLAGSPSPALAAWVEVESENFIFVGDASEKGAKRIVRDLEVFRSTVLAIVGVGNEPEQRKVRVFGLRGSGKIRKVTGRKQIAGIYTVGNDYPVFVTDLNGGIQSIRETAYHEFAHHIINTYGNAYYPRWYNEGFAEFLASFEIEKERIIVGRPGTDFGYSLNNANWLDIETLTGAITRYPFKSNGSIRESENAQMFYGMSWLAVHYIQNTPDLKSGFSAYIASLNTGEDSTKAFEDNFGLSLKDFYKQLRSYWKRDRFNMFHFDAAPFTADLSISARKLEDAEVEKKLAEIRVLFLQRGDDHKRERDKAREELNDLVEEFGSAVEFLRAQVSLAITEDDHNAAVAIAEQALELYPDNPAAMQTLADALFHRHPTGGEPSREDYLRSRELFAQVISLEPMNPTANSHYPETFVFGGDEPDEMALRAVNVDLQFNRSPSNFDSYLNAAEIYMLAGRPDYSCALLKPIELWIRREAADQDEDESEDSRNNNNQRLQRLNRLDDEVSSSCAT